MMVVKLEMNVFKSIIKDLQYQLKQKQKEIKNYKYKMLFTIFKN